jgi:hypothetical protein
LTLGVCGSAVLASPALARSIGYYAKNSVALAGADVVAYFTKGEMRMGQSIHRVDWRGTTWVFETAENLALFEADPYCHAPQFGGHCAYGMSKAQLFPPDPKAFAVVDDKLYLMHSVAYRDLWSKDAASQIMLGRANWAIMTSDG